MIRPTLNARGVTPRRSAALLAARLVQHGGSRYAVIALLAPWLLAAPAARAQAAPPGRDLPLQVAQATRAPQSQPLAAAQIALRSGDPARALAITEQALKIQASDPQLRFTRAMALVALKRSAEAEGGFRSLTQDYPELPEPYNNLAFVLAARGDLNGARAALEEAIRALPGYPLAHENLGDIHVKLAAEHYRNASQLAAGNNRAVAEAAAAKLRLTEQIAAGRPGSGAETKDGRNTPHRASDP